MASAQVLPGSAASTRKQGHLEAGKKRLEEFRKKKAEGRAKKTASTGQLQSAEVDQNVKDLQSRENDRSGGILGGDFINANKPSALVMDHEEEIINSFQEYGTGFANGTHANPPIWFNNNHASDTDLRKDSGKDEISKSYGKDESLKSYENSFSVLANGYHGHWRDENSVLNLNGILEDGPTYGIVMDHPFASSSFHTLQNIQANDSHLSSSDLVEAQLEENKKSSKSNMGVTETSGACLPSTLTEKSGSNAEQNSSGFAGTSVDTSADETRSIFGVEQHVSIRSNHNNHIKLDVGGSKMDDSISHHLNIDSSPWQALEPSSTDLNSSFKSSFIEHAFPLTGSIPTNGRSRPSFLDSLGVPRVSSTPLFSESEKANSAISNSKPWSAEIPSLTSPQQEFSTVVQSFRARSSDLNSDELAMKSSASLNDEQVHVLDVKEHHAQRNNDLPVLKKDEDFAALEQHIEDLTQEKFSLQRTLDTSQALAESLAVENSSLTDSYNQQGKVVSQLKSDMERLREEIKAQLLALESVKMEYTNAQLECNAADERAKILASEVISLEEKALRLRSNELKLEKQLENLNSEITSYKRKVSSFEKEHQDFQSTIDALQKEKKLLQSKLWKASANGKVTDAKTVSSQKKDVSTSTEGLGAETSSMVDGEANVAESMLSSTINAPDAIPCVVSLSNISNFSLPPENSGLHLSDASGDIPHDQLRMVENIRSLISELALEKEELMQALTIESSNNSKLKDLNKDLLQKLEAQTQRLELLTAQRMANENVTGKSIDIRNVNDTTEYADEGDEVVERVLGWIMKLFPGGPAKRRTSKLL